MQFQDYKNILNMRVATLTRALRNAESLGMPAHGMPAALQSTAFNNPVARMFRVAIRTIRINRTAHCGTPTVELEQGVNP